MIASKGMALTQPRYVPPLSLLVRISSSLCRWPRLVLHSPPKYQVTTQERASTAVSPSTAGMRTMTLCEPYPLAQLIQILMMHREEHHKRVKKYNLYCPFFPESSGPKARSRMTFTFSSLTEIACKLKTTSACHFRDLYITF